MGCATVEVNVQRCTVLNVGSEAQREVEMKLEIMGCDCQRLELLTDKEVGGDLYNSEIRKAKKKCLEKRKNCNISTVMPIIKANFV